MNLTPAEIKEAATLLSASSGYVYADLDEATRGGMRMLVGELWKLMAPTERDIAKHNLNSEELTAKFREGVIAVFMAWMGDPPVRPSGGPDLVFPPQGSDHTE